MHSLGRKRNHGQVAGTRECLMEGQHHPPEPLTSDPQDGLGALTYQTRTYTRQKSLIMSSLRVKTVTYIEIPRAQNSTDRHSYLLKCKLVGK